MEEHVGQLWHRLITRAAATDHPAAAVTLEQVERPLGILFRALGGDGGLQVTNASATAHGARRNWLQRLAGSHRQVQLAWRDEQTLRLPERIALFPEAALNRDLYLWLAALNAHYPRHAADWFGASQHACRRVLERLPGLRERYRRLVEAHLARRPDPAHLPADEAAQEHAIRAALLAPGSMP
ncbi:MAG TPA: nitric oxide reductase, partial [Candidatus Competibacteraceae bacterium]|nr:nitric oxide reductase [Candidatus Competibacteraceae bacterium]